MSGDRWTALRRRLVGTWEVVFLTSVLATGACEEFMEGYREAREGHREARNDAEPLTDEEFRAVFAEAWEIERRSMTDAYESDLAALKRVDRFDYDEGSHVLTLEATAFHSRDYYERNPDRLADDMWEIHAAHADAWGSIDDDLAGMAASDPAALTPGFVVVLNGEHRGECSGELVARLADRDASRSEWSEGCEVDG